MSRYLSNIILITFFITLISKTDATPGAQPIGVSQVGFNPNDQKIASVVDGLGTEFTLVRIADSESVYSGSLSAPQFWEACGYSLRLADFSDFQEAGEYRVVVGAFESAAFEIKQGIYDNVSKLALRYFYLNRSSTAIEEKFAGEFARPLGYPDTEVYLHKSAATEDKQAETVMSSPKGWFDAGDYGKYVVNSAISTYTLLRMYHLFPEYFEEQDLNIPESNQPLADVLYEIRWNLDWMLTMQDPSDGGVFHKLTTEHFVGLVMPETVDLKRYVFAKSTAASLDLAATAAYASRVFEKLDPEYSAQCLQAAKLAWKWATQNPEKYFKNPEGIYTGEYGDSNLSDEFDWAAAELYATTGNQDYLNKSPFETPEYDVPGWGSVSLLGQFSLALDKKDDKAIEKVLEVANGLLSMQKESGNRVSMRSKDFYWGSNGVASNKAMTLLIAYELTQNESYKLAAQNLFDYLLGRNPLAFCYVSGVGSTSMMHPHHRISEADGIEAPHPGMLSGGPNPDKQDAQHVNTYPASSAPALAYTDVIGSYASNEIAINWNAPFAFVANALSALAEE